ncbi:MAG: hypothetical protein EZS28_054784, partial [Streblomastix strix]
MVKDSKYHELPLGFTSIYSLSQTSAANPNTASQGSLTEVNQPIPIVKGQTALQAAAAQQIAAQTAQSALIVQNVPSGLNVAENVDFLPFRLNSTQLSLQTGSSGTIQVRFTPITLGTQQQAASGSSNIGGAGASGAQGSSLNSGLYQGAIGTARFPVTFHPKGPGEYPCRIILRSPLDL